MIKKRMKIEFVLEEIAEPHLQQTKLVLQVRGTDDKGQTTHSLAISRVIDDMARLSFPGVQAQVEYEMGNQIGAKLMEELTKQPAEQHEMAGYLRPDKFRGPSDLFHVSGAQVGDTHDPGCGAIQYEPAEEERTEGDDMMDFFMNRGDYRR